MRHTWMTAAFLLVGQMPAMAQQPSAPARQTVTFDAAAIRKQAAQMGEIRSLLADPDPNVRLLAIREIARSGDAIQRQLAIEAGLSSVESSMQQIALRALFADTHQINVTLFNADGSEMKEGDVSLNLTMEKFDAETGRIDGRGWHGQIQGAVFAFITDYQRPGTLIWNAESGEFIGTFNVDATPVKGVRKAVWRPR